MVPEILDRNFRDLCFAYCVKRDVKGHKIHPG
jgi:hypothetical protein